MVSPTNVVGLEILVLSLSDAVDVCVDAFGWELVFRGPTNDVSGERAVLDAGSITVTLLEAADSGPNLLTERAPRFTQIVLGGDAGEMSATADRLTGLGVPTHDAGPGRRFVPPEAMAGIFGFEAAIMLQQIDPDVEAGPGEASTA